MEFAATTDDAQRCAPDDVLRCASCGFDNVADMRRCDLCDAHLPGISPRSWTSTRGLRVAARAPHPMLLDLRDGLVALGSLLEAAAAAEPAKRLRADETTPRTCADEAGGGAAKKKASITPSCSAPAAPSSSAPPRVAASFSAAASSSATATSSSASATSSAASAAPKARRHEPTPPRAHPVHRQGDESLVCRAFEGGDGTGALIKVTFRPKQGLLQYEVGPSAMLYWGVAEDEFERVVQAPSHEAWLCRRVGSNARASVWACLACAMCPRTAFDSQRSAGGHQGRRARARECARQQRHSAAHVLNPCETRCDDSA